MSSTIVLQVSIFIIILVGAVAKKLGIISPAGQKSITDLELFIVLPCNIFKSFLVDLSSDLLIQCLQVLLISMGIQIVVIFYSKLVFRGISDSHFRCMSYGMICSNAGFLGNPVAEGIYGSIGLLLASVYLIPVRFMMWSSGIAIYSGISDKKAALKKVITNPCIIACFIGLIFMLMGWTLPAPLLKPVTYIANCNTALSIMCIGFILADIDLKSFVEKDVIIYTLHRLIILPAIVFAVCKLIGMSTLVTGLSVILCAMPAGATTSMLADKYNMAPQFATKLVIFSTLMSIPSIFIWSLILAG